MFAKFPKSPASSVPNTPGGLKGRILCRLCRQELAGKEHLLHMLPVTPSVPGSPFSRSPAASRSPSFNGTVINTSKGASGALAALENSALFNTFSDFNGSAATSQDSPLLQSSMDGRTASNATKLCEASVSHVNPTVGAVPGIVRRSSTEGSGVRQPLPPPPALDCEKEGVSCDSSHVKVSL